MRGVGVGSRCLGVFGLVVVRLGFCFCCALWWGCWFLFRFLGVVFFVVLFLGVLFVGGLVWCGEGGFVGCRGFLGWVWCIRGFFLALILFVARLGVWSGGWVGRWRMVGGGWWVGWVGFWGVGVRLVLFVGLGGVSWVVVRFFWILVGCGCGWWLGR